MSAVAGFWPLTGRLECLAAFPGIPSLADVGQLTTWAALTRRCTSARSSSSRRGAWWSSPTCYGRP